MTRPFQRTPSGNTMVSDGPVLDDCAEGMPPPVEGMPPPLGAPGYIAPGTVPDLMPPAGPPGVMESGGSQYLSPPRRLVPRPRAQEMPYTP